MTIYVSRGRKGEILTSNLPSGDFTLKGSGEDWFVATARSIAKENGGKWSEQHGNWVIPKQNQQKVKESLLTQLNSNL